MKVLLIVVIGFLILLYLYTYIKYKRRRKNQMTTVDHYHKNYLERNKASKDNSYEEHTIQKQITKYNSSVDYMEWNDLVTEINDQKKSANPKVNKSKRFQY